jgi:hypothetical protein
VGQILGGKAAERSYITAVAQPVAEMLETEPVVEAARPVPVKHLKIDPLPVALDSDSGKPGHQPPSDPLSARRVGDKQIFEIHPGSAEPSREPGVEQGKTGGLAVEKSERRPPTGRRSFCARQGADIRGASPLRADRPENTLTSNCVNLVFDP